MANNETAHNLELKITKLTLSDRLKYDEGKYSLETFIHGEFVFILSPGEWMFKHMTRIDITQHNDERFPDGEGNYKGWYFYKPPSEDQGIMRFGLRLPAHVVALIASYYKNHIIDSFVMNLEVIGQSTPHDGDKYSFAWMQDTGLDNPLPVSVKSFTLGANEYELPK